MKFASIRLVTSDVDRLVAFYAALTGATANRFAPQFAEFRFDTVALAISGEQLIRQFNAGAAVAAANRSAIVEFEVNTLDEVDAVHERLGSAGVEIAMPPADMPWATAPCCCAIPTAMSSMSSRGKAVRPDRRPSVGGARP